MRAAEIEAEKELRRVHGMTRDDLTTEQVGSFWLDLVEAALKEQWDIYMSERQSEADEPTRHDFA
jgi:hypothetical protein